MKKFAAWLVVTSLLGAQAQAAKTGMGCMTDEEFSNLLLLIAPDALKSMGEQCAAVLPKGAVLGNPDSQVMKNFTVASEGALSRMGPLFARFASESGLTATPALGEVFKEAFLQEMKKDMKGLLKNPKDCQAADRLLKLTEPLPPVNLAAMIVEIGRMAEKGKDGFLCPRN